MDKNKEYYTILDPATMKLVNPRAYWRDKSLSAEFHGRTFTKEQAGDFLARECKRRGNNENTETYARNHTFNWNLNRGIIIPVA